MATSAEPTLSGTQQPLAGALAGFRRRWRWRHLAVGIELTLGVMLVAFWLAAMALQAARFAGASVTVARWSLGLLVAIAAARWVVYPLVRRVDDAQLALYLEERVPELGGAVLSAVEVAQARVPDDGRSPLLMRGLFDDAARRLRRTPAVGRIEDAVTRRALALSALVVASGAALVMLGPSWVGQSARLLLTPWRDEAAAPVYAIDVAPGDATIARGSDVEVGAELRGFNSDVVELSIRRGAAGEWERVPMGPGRDSSRFTARIFDLTDDAEYYVESNGVRSAPFALTVKDLPAVRQIDLELRYPAYTGLAVERLDDVGDIAAVRGTRATVRVRATQAVRGGRIVIDGDSAVTLAPVDDSTLSATIAVRRDGFYRVELQAGDGTQVAGNVDYVIDAMDDLAPQVVVRKPGRDVRPTNVEEVLIEAEASDDYGVGRMELHYQVNGGETRTIVLADGQGRRPRELSAGHTIFLEELGLQPGDVVSYFAKVWDNDAVSGVKRATSDIYFLTIRGFDREYRQNQQGGGGGGGGEGGDDPGTLVARQREIVAATFKAERDRPARETAEFRNDVTTIHLSQGQLREQVQRTLERIQRPAVQATDTTFKVMAALMPTVVAEMRAAEEQLAARRLQEALAPEQRALQLLERVDALFREVQVSMQDGGGGGGGGNASAEDLADLFELETDKLRNQYEQLQSGAQQQASRDVDETLERLKRLAARQQQENERARQRAQAGSSGGAGGGGQRQMAEEAEQLARRLERLAREQESPEMQQTARALQDAANAMRRSAASEGQRGSGSGTAAQDRLEAARRLLEESRGKQTSRGVEGAAARAQQLARQQREVQADVARLDEGGDRAERERRLDERRLDERKDQMARDVEQLEQQLDQLSRDALRDRAQTARKLKDAANAIREGRIDDKIRFSRDVMRGASREYANNVEGQIADDLDRLRERVAAASSAAVNDSAQRTTRSLAQARELVRSLASIEERMRERTEGRADGAPDEEAGRRQPDRLQAGAPGRQGEQAQGGRQGQAGPAGQGGQQGQPGQQGAGGRQGQAGQPGQPGQQGQGGRQGGGGGAMPNGGRLRGQGQGAPGGGRLSPEEARQFTRELRAQREGAESLRRDLVRDGRDAADLDRLIARLRQLESGRSFNDPEELARLRVAVLEGFKEFEFSLRRELGERERQGPVLGGGNEVPPGYRDLVSEYFRALSRKGKP